jgi:polysaccharide biosynthesis/export protein ExoF
MRVFIKSLLLTGIVAATLGAAPVHADYRLGVSDRLKIKVQEWPDLAGEYTVNTDGFLSLPMIGEVLAEGRHARDLADDISNRLQQRAGGSERPVAAVEIVQYRPFFIIGDVQRPGEYPYRPGLTVLQAIGIAGGYYRPNDVGLLRLERDISLANGELESLSLKVTRLMARAARLTAALNNQAEIKFPEELSDVKANPELAAILAVERTAHALDRRAIAQEAAGLEAIRTLYQQEIDTLRGRVESLKGEKEVVQRQLQEIRALSGRGLALAPTQTTLERTVAQISSEQLGVGTAIVRAQESIALAEQKVREQAIERSRTATRDQQAAMAEMADAQARMLTLRELLLEAQTLAPAAARDRAFDGGVREKIVIMRREGADTRTLETDETFLLNPSDVIRVPVLARKTPAGRASLFQTRSAGP